MSPHWHKILRDLWEMKGRTLLIILSVAVGVVGVRVVMSTQSSIAVNIPEQYARVNPADVIISCEGFDQILVDSLKKMDGVKTLEGRFTLSVKVQTGNGQWSDLQLVALPDFDNILVNKIQPRSGEWPPHDHSVILEQSSLALMSGTQGQNLAIRTQGGKTRQMRVGGLAQDINEAAGIFSNQARGFITLETLEWLGYPRQFNELLLITTQSGAGSKAVRDIANQVTNKIEKGGLEVYWTTVTDPSNPWFQPYLTPMIAILEVLSVLALLLGGFLVVNVVNAMMASQIRQIGIIKAIGGGNPGIFGLYLGVILLIGVLALIISIPSGWILSRVAAQAVAGLINFTAEKSGDETSILIIQILLTLLVPALASLFPILSGVRVTVREALTNYGVAPNSFGRNLLDRVLSRISILPGFILLSLRNTFRRKTRLILTLITLSIAGAIFIGVLSVYNSLRLTLSETLQYYAFDLMVSFDRPYRVDQMLHQASRANGIAYAEPWGVSVSHQLLPGGGESQEILLVAPPADTQVIQPKILSGRWLIEGDETAAVVNTDVIRQNPTLKVGDTLQLKVGRDTYRWKIVGVMESSMVGPWVYVNYTYYAQLLKKPGYASMLYISTTRHDSTTITRVTTDLETNFSSAGLRTSSINPVSDLREAIVQQFNVLVLFLVVMAMILALVGGFGLIGTMSLNVLERRREIGVMRAVGASRGSVYRIVTTEGALIGVISWGIASLLAFPLSRFMSDMVGQGFLQIPLTYDFSIEGVVLWLGLIVLLSIIASSLPALNATRFTVRDLLAYE